MQGNEQISIAVKSNNEQSWQPVIIFNGEFRYIIKKEISARCGRFKLSLYKEFDQWHF